MDKYKDFLETLRSRLSIIEVISKKTKLVRRGHDYFGLCPFHHEKTGSFKVDPARGLYYCFGCGKHGDIFTFVMESENILFSDAVEKLASSVGLDVPRIERHRDKDQSMYALLERIQFFFEDNLSETDNKGVLNYISYRGISLADIKKFHIGFANNTIKLITILKGAGFSDDELIKSGVFFKYGMHLKNKFEGRLIFPIFNSSGRCIAFGGRTLTNEMPKYLNSPETEIFKKSENLYGYNLARKGQYKDLIIVEGYLDVISMHRVGFDKTVAGLGTAIGEGHIDLCWKICDEPIVLLDGDSAGIKAAYRFMIRILPKLEPGKSFKFAIIPNDEDPDSIIVKGGVKNMQTILNNAMSLQAWLWRSSFSLFPSETPEQKTAVLQKIRDNIETIQNKSIRLLYNKWFNSQTSELLFKKSEKNKNVFTDKISAIVPNSEKNQEILLALVIMYPYILDVVIERFVEISFENPRYKIIRDQILKEYNEKNNIDEIKEKIYNSEYEFLIKVKSYIGLNFEEDETLDRVLQEWNRAFDSYFSTKIADKEFGETKQKFKSSFSIEDWNKFKALKMAMFKINKTE